MKWWESEQGRWIFGAIATAIVLLGFGGCNALMGGGGFEIEMREDTK